MAKVDRFEDLEMWQVARQLVSVIYALSNKGLFSKDYGFRDQICRTAVSIMSNIAEGFERHSDKSFASFLAIAQGSAAEVRSQLYAALDIGYISEAEFKSVSEIAMRTSMMITKFLQYLRNFPTPSSRRSDDLTIRRSDD